MKARRVLKKALSILLAPLTDKVEARIVSLNTDNLLDNRTALITGGYGGLGKSLAKKFLESGAKVIITGRSKEKLDTVQKDLAQEFGEERIGTVILDNTKAGEFESVIHGAIARYGDIDILVNNAGRLGGAMPDATVEVWDSVIDTNLRSVFFLTQFFLNYFKAKRIKGNILNIASSSSLRPAHSAYNVSKWGVRGITVGAARMGAPYGITVNGIAPGPTATPMLGKDVHDSGLTHPLNPIGRYAHPEEIANMAVMLVSDAGRTIVGDIIYMSGGGRYYNL